MIDMGGTKYISIPSLVILITVHFLLSIQVVDGNTRISREDSLQVRMSNQHVSKGQGSRSTKDRSSRPVFGGIITSRPNYTLPACQISRRDAPWRPEATKPGRPLRVLVVGMQSSGASTFLFLLAQIPNTAAVVDLWVGRPAPTPEQLRLSSSVSAVVLKVCSVYLSFFRLL